MEELILEDDGQCPVMTTSRLSTALNRPLNPDYMLVLGFVVCAAGWVLSLFWIILAGFLFFFLGIQGIKAEGGEGGHEAGDVSEKPRAPLV